MIYINKVISPVYGHQTYDDFVGRYQAMKNVELHDLGESEDPSKNLYGIQFGDTENKPCIFLVGSIHGTEWESAYWTLFFIEMITDPSKAPPTERKYFNYLRNKYSFYAIPITNPWGFENMERHNYNGVDANRDFNDLTQKETVIITDKFKELKPVLAIDNHSASIDYHSFGTNNSPCERLFFEFRKSLRLSLADNTVDFYPAGGFETSRPGTGREWFSNQESSRGLNTLSVLLEGFYSLRQHEFLEEKGTFGLTSLLLTCLYMDMYMTRGVQNPSNSDIDSLIN